MLCSPSSLRWCRWVLWFEIRNWIYIYFPKNPFLYFSRCLSRHCGAAVGEFGKYDLKRSQKYIYICQFCLFSIPTMRSRSILCALVYDAVSLSLLLLAAAASCSGDAAPESISSWCCSWIHFVAVRSSLLCRRFGFGCFSSSSLPPSHAGSGCLPCFACRVCILKPLPHIFVFVSLFPRCCIVLVFAVVVAVMLSVSFVIWDL